MAKTIKEGIALAQDTMELVARAFKDRGETVYTASLHAQAAGLSLKKVFHGENAVEPTGAAYAAVFAALHNHSAWRQKHERAEIFPKKAEAGDLVAKMAELEEEVG